MTDWTEMDGITGLGPRAEVEGLLRLRKVDTSRLSARVRPRVKTRGVPPALRDHLVYATSDVGEAEWLGRPLFGPHRIRVLDSVPGDFEASWHAVRFRNVTLGHLDFGARVELSAEQLPSDGLLLVPMSGTSVVTTARGTTEASPIRAVMPRPGPLTMRCERQTAQLAVVVERQALAVHLSRLLGRSLDHPLVFDLELDLAAGTSSRWNFAIQMLHAELLDPGSLLHQGVGIGQLEEFLMSSLLYAHRSNYSDPLTAAARPVEHRVTRVAKDYIEMHLREPMRVTTVADAVGVSIRTLESAFRSDLRATPTSYIRSRRLERIRADLADAGPGVTVTATALRWGSTHLGRFASEYHARFGETPSQTLRH
ncbi:MAG: AraC family transcriptional regulator [Acidimicrobiales bacterium]